jgi:hypothetical protein
MWYCWKDKIQDLIRFHAKGRSGRAIRLGEAVIIRDANVKRLLWTSGMFLELINGRDGRIRAAQVRTPGGTILERDIRGRIPNGISSQVSCFTWPFSDLCTAFQVKYDSEQKTAPLAYFTWSLLDLDLAKFQDREMLA